MEEDIAVVKFPNLEYAEWKFLLTQSNEIVPNKEEIKQKLFAVIKTDSKLDSQSILKWMPNSYIVKINFYPVVVQNCSLISADMLPFYQNVCEDLKWKPDTELIAQMKKTNEKILCSWTLQSKTQLKTLEKARSEMLCRQKQTFMLELETRSLFLSSVGM